MWFRLASSARGTAVIVEVIAGKSGIANMGLGNHLGVDSYDIVDEEWPQPWLNVRRFAVPDSIEGVIDVVAFVRILKLALCEPAQVDRL
jgi:hypothetical protein